MGNKQGKRNNGNGPKRSATTTTNKTNPPARNTSAPPPRDGISARSNEEDAGGGLSGMMMTKEPSRLLLTEDNSGPSEPVSIKELDGSARAPQPKVSVEDFELLKASSGRSCRQRTCHVTRIINRFWAKEVSEKS